MTQYIVYDHVTGDVNITDTMEDAVKEYEYFKQENVNHVSNEGQFSGSEMIILAEIKKMNYSVETDSPVLVEKDDGEKEETDEFYWDWKESEETE